LTTAVGSYPKPDYITSARARVSRGDMDRAKLHELEKQATAHWIQLQEELDLDILVDGEMYRGDMATYFSENMEGFVISGLVRSYGNRYYRKPTAVEAVGRKAPITVDWWQYAQSLTSKPVKGMLTGPYTMADWSFNEYYSTFEEFVLEMARALHEEVVDLERAGAKYIQIDEPAASTRPEEMELVSRALGIVTEGLKAVTITHICYGDFAQVYDHLINLPVTVLDLEMTNSDYGLLEMFKEVPPPPDKALSIGVTDVHSHLIESVEEIKRGIKRGLEVFPPERLYVDPDCGLKTRREDEAVAKLRNMVQAVGEVKQELGIE
jgi:5-methyltetrahydropteroyltriglutamate--homocysteine methyltransferase